MKLRVALAIRLAAVVALALVILTVFVTRQTRADLLSQVDDRMRGALAGQARDLPLTPPPPPASAAGSESRASAHLVIDSQGTVLMSGPSGTRASPDPLPVLTAEWIQHELAGAARPGRAGFVNAESGNIRYRIMAVRRADGNLDVEATPMTFVDKSIADLIRTLTLGSGAVLIGAGLTSFAVLRRSLKPLGLMAHAAGQIADGDVSLDPGASSPHAELQELGTALDVMVCRLRASINERSAALVAKDEVEQRLRQFVSDASHELQTPITSIRGWAELYRQGGLSDSDALAKAMLRVETGSARMGRLVDDLLVLARSDEQRQPRRHPVDLGPICADAVTDAGAIEPGRVISFVDKRITCTGATSSKVAGDPDSLRQIIDNLLTNARLHTPPCTTIEVTVSNHSTGIEITVADHGPGFQADQFEHVFDRFWRSGRSPDGATLHARGSGLGLSIARAVVNAHGGTITVHNAPTGGAVVTMQLPLMT